MTKRATRGLYHGYLVIDKPAGWTSHDVVGRIRRILGERRVGHAGTLDPSAVGVLPIAVGLATRTVEYLSASRKTYIADVTFGVMTDSADIDGDVVDVQPAGHVTRKDVEAALQAFEGDLMQTPPLHSAVKVNGERLYNLARRGEHVHVEPRPVTIHRIEMREWEPPVATILVECSKGTYIRSLARDLGDAIGPGAYMSNLVRVQTGPFTLDDAMRIDDLPALLEHERWETIAFHPDAVLHDWPAMVLDPRHSTMWRQGKPIPVENASGTVRVYDASGEWLGVGRADDAGLHIQPVKVVSEE
jgi:tRNA pseudouridine55 synthase